MTLEELLKDKREEILKIAKKYGAYNVRVFGSIAAVILAQVATLIFS